MNKTKGKICFCLWLYIHFMVFDKPSQLVTAETNCTTYSISFRNVDLNLFFTSTSLSGHSPFKTRKFVTKPYGSIIFSMLFVSSHLSFTAKNVNTKGQFTRSICVCVKLQEWKQMMMFTLNISVFKKDQRQRSKANADATCNSSLTIR